MDQRQQTFSVQSQINSQTSQLEHMHQQVIDKVYTVQQEVHEMRNKFHEEVQQRQDARQSAYDKLKSDL